jgi:alpha-mannosidase
LWRMGYEFDGGRWRQAGRASEHPVSVTVKEHQGGLELIWPGEFGGEIIERAMWLPGDSPVIYFRLVGRADRRHTITARFDTGFDAEFVFMDNPGAVISRPLEKVYSPTFWPFQHFVHLRDRKSDRGLALYQRWPGAVSVRSGGVLRVVALRNAVVERAYRFFPLSGNPASGYEREMFTFEYAVEFTSSGDWRENKLPARAYVGARWPWREKRRIALESLAYSQLTMSREDVFLLADKPASQGRGRIVRLYTHSAQGELVSLQLLGREISSAWLCDSQERDIQPLDLAGGAVELRMPGTFATLRLIT